MTGSSRGRKFFIEWKITELFACAIREKNFGATVVDVFASIDCQRSFYCASGTNVNDEMEAALSHGGILKNCVTRIRIHNRADSQRMVRTWQLI